MHDANDNEPRLIDPVDDQMGPMGMTADGRMDLASLPGDLGKFREHIENSHEAFKVIVGLIRPPGFSRVIPDAIEVSYGRRSEPVSLNPSSGHTRRV